MNIPTAMKAKLSPGEKIIHVQEGGFQYSGISIVGTHTLCITNLGIVMAHDTGGMFGTERLMEMAVNDSGLEVIYCSYAYSSSARIRSIQVSPFQVSLDLPLKKLEECLNEMPERCFRFTETVKGAYILYTEIPPRNARSKFLIVFKKDGVELKDEAFGQKTEIPYSRMSAIESLGRHSLRLEGTFEIDGKTLSSMEWFVPDLKAVEWLKQLQRLKPQLSDLTGEYVQAAEVTVDWIEEGIKRQTKMSLVKKSSGSWIIADEANWKIIEEFSQRVDKLYYDKSGHTVILKKPESVYVLNFRKSDDPLFKPQAWHEQRRILHESMGQLNGEYGTSTFKNTKVRLLNEPHQSFALLDWDTLSVLASRDQKTDIIESGSDMFILSENEVAVVSWEDENWKNAFEEKRRILFKDSKLGLTALNEPFRMHQSPKKLEFRQSDEKIAASFDTADIRDISILELVDPQTGRVQVGISTAGTAEPFVVSIGAEEVPGLIERTYRFGKTALVQQMSSSRLYLSWTRQMNDFALYHLFGQLYALQAGVEEIRQAFTDTKERNLALLNFMYYAIQNQKRRVDQVSIYLPAMLEHSSNKLVEASGQTHDEEPFRMMQYGFIGVGNRIKQSLTELDSALSPVYSLIVERPDISETIKSKTKRGYMQAAATAGAGLAITALSGGLALPLLLGGAFMGANSYSSSKDAHHKMELDAKHDADRLDFYMRKALDSLDHFMTTLAPFYISEVNRSMLGSFKQLAPVYKAALADSTASTQLFSEIGNLYTFKQLPIDESVTMKRAALVQEIHESSQLAQQFVQNFQNEVKFHVPK